ncbi:MAG: hypothetical protein CVU56_09395 [Deltaproteobacteria bacterium HGW-Deltaproteobacteria-14]|nr:MAG: hypothetical protein CVU56_09395 [Deltaproteobacteria bacterium HGW-Deltaproteobacteria-14]
MGGIQPNARGAEHRADFTVGAVRVRVETAEAALRDPLRDACAGYVAGGTDPAVAVRLVVDLAAEPAAGLPELPRLALAADGATLVDVSEGWELTLSPSGLEPQGRAHLRRWREDPALWRLQVEGLVRVVAATLAPAAGGALVHGCAMVAPEGDRAALFVGASGDGKTTMTRRLPGWRALADDTAWLGRAGAGWVVAGTPFAGKERLPRSGEVVPLSGIFTLAPSSPLALTPLEAAPAFFELASRTLWFAPAWGGTQALWDLLAAAAAEVRVWRLASHLEDAVAPAVGAALDDPEGACSQG